MVDVLRTPRTSRGALVAVGLAAFIVVLIYGTMLLTYILGAIVIAFILLLVYALGCRLVRLFRDTPVRGRRGRRRRGGRR